MKVWNERHGWKGSLRSEDVDCRKLYLLSYLLTTIFYLLLSFPCSSIPPPFIWLLHKLRALLLLLELYQRLCTRSIAFFAHGICKKKERKHLKLKYWELDAWGGRVSELALDGIQMFVESECWALLQFSLFYTCLKQTSFGGILLLQKK